MMGFFERIGKWTIHLYNYLLEEIENPRTAKIVLCVVILLILTPLVIVFYKLFKEWGGIILVIIFICSLDRLVKYGEEDTRPIAAVPEYQVIASLIFEILSKDAVIIGLDRPFAAEDLFPVKVQLVQYLGNARFYHFICRKAPNSTFNTNTAKTILSTSMAQIIQSGFPNVPLPSYNGYPPYAILSVGEDEFHAGYVCIDVIPVDSSDSIAIVNKRAYSEALDRTTINNANVTDKDF